MKNDGRIDVSDINLNEYIQLICDMLKLEVPKLIFTNEHLVSDTEWACYSFKDHEIFIRENSKITLEVLFSIAHELRHAWQSTYHANEYLEDYIPREEFNNIIEYNKQPAEIDANAFAIVIMVNIFHRQPIIDTLTDEIKKLIMERAVEIVDEMSKM